MVVNPCVLRLVSTIIILSLFILHVLYIVNGFTKNNFPKFRKNKKSPYFLIQNYGNPRHRSLCYSTERRHILQLTVFERKVLSKILEAVRVDDIWKRYNSELMALYEDLDIVSFIKLNWLRWIGHIHRMENTRKITQVFYNNPQGSRQRGRPSFRRLDDVQTDLEKCGFRDWKPNVKDREEWRRLMSRPRIFRL